MKSGKSKDVKWVYGHVATELFMDQHGCGYKIFSVCDCGKEADAGSVSEELAIRYAEMGKKTLLIHTDLYSEEKNIYQNSSIKKKGFVEYLSGDSTLKDILCGPYRNNLYYIGRGGRTAGNKEQILCSQKTETLLSAFREEYDAIFLHTPSLAAPVSGKILCRLTDAVLFVVAIGKTKKAQLEEAKRQMDMLGIPIAGVMGMRGDRAVWGQYINRFSKENGDLS